MTVGLTRRVALVVAAVLAVTTGALALTSPAEAATYRFWTYWAVPADADDWQFAQVGADRRPADGSVEGWRFAISPSSNAAPSPRLDPARTFADVCGDTPEAAGKKRVALVVDFGTEPDEPSNQQRPGDVHHSCVVAEPSTSGYGVLHEAGFRDVRIRAGMVCGINGYPAVGCGDAATAAPVDGDPAVAEEDVPVVAGPPASSSDGSSPWALVVAVLAVALLGGGAFWKARRSR